LVGATGTAGRVVCVPTAAGPAAITENAAAFPLFRFAVALSNGFQPPQRREAACGHWLTELRSPGRHFRGFRAGPTTLLAMCVVRTEEDGSTL